MPKELSQITEVNSQFSITVNISQPTSQKLCIDNLSVSTNVSLLLKEILEFLFEKNYADQMSKWSIKYMSI